jgi:hypothetical protein
MKYNIEIDFEFSKEFKELLKKFPSLKLDFQNILDNLENELLLADDLGMVLKKLGLILNLKEKGLVGVDALLLMKL